MPVHYIETSALIKKYRTEKGTEVITELFQQRQGNEVLLTSYFTAVEVISVVTRLLRGGELTREAYQVVMGNLARDLEEVFLLQSVADGVLSNAIDLIQEHALRAPDAIHLATALGLDYDTRGDDFHFWGSHARLNAACASCNISVINPEKADALVVCHR